MAPKNSRPMEEFPLDNHGQGPRADLRDESSSRGMQRQDRPAVEPTPPVEIVEQPVEESRFRYSRESRTNGSILGVSSVEGNRTYPSIRVNSYRGLVKIRVSCVSKDRPHRPHPHRIVGRENCSKGVYTRTTSIREQNQTLELKNIGIQCTKREKIASALQERAEEGVDPFGTGYNTTFTSNLLHYVRLAIEVLIPDSAGGWVVYGVAVSDVITDLPTKLKIFHISHKHGSAYGDTQITLLTSRLPNNEQLVVRFQELASGWRVEVRPQRVHHLFSLVVNTPPYRNPNMYFSAPVTIHLVRPPSGDPDVDKHMVGEPCNFLYTPGPDYDPISHSGVLPKKQRTDRKPLHPSLQHVQADPESADLPPEPQPSTSTANTDLFSELDQWFFERMSTPQSSQEILTQNSINRTIQPQPVQSLDHNFFQGSRSTMAQCSQTERYYQGGQLPSSFSESNWQSQQNNLQGANNSFSGTNLQDPFGRSQLPQTRLLSNQPIPVPESRTSHGNQRPQTETLPNQVRVENNGVQQWLPTNNVYHAQELQTPHSLQNNLNTPRPSINEAPQREPTLKRNHSQIAGNSRSHINIEPTQIPLLRTQYSQTEQLPIRPNFPGQRSEIPNSYDIPQTKASNSTATSQGNQLLPHQQKQPSVVSLLETRHFPQMFLEIPPTDLQVQSNTIAEPSPIRAVPNSIPQFPLVDLTGCSEEYSMARSLDHDELRYFEAPPPMRLESWEEILSSTAEEWTYQQVTLTEDQQLSTATSNMAAQANPSPEDIEILTLSDEIKKVKVIENPSDKGNCNGN